MPKAYLLITTGDIIKVLNENGLPLTHRMFYYREKQENVSKFVREKEKWRKYAPEEAVQVALEIWKYYRGTINLSYYEKQFKEAFNI